MTAILLIVALACLVASLTPQPAKDALWGAFWGVLLLVFVISVALRWAVFGRWPEIIAGPFDY